MGMRTSSTFRDAKLADDQISSPLYFLRGHLIQREVVRLHFLLKVNEA
jgi:hypothetical protein